MTLATFIQKKDFKFIRRIGAFLSVLVVLSCGKTNTDDVAPQSLLTPEQYSIEVAKTLYNSIKVSNYNLKATKENFIANVTKHENDVVRNTANTLSTSKRFSNLFNAPVSSNARNSADEVGDINLGNVQSELNSAGLPDNVRKKVIQLGSRLTNLKAELAQKDITDPAGIKVEVDREMADFESTIVSDNSLSVDEKTILFSFTIATRDNLDNVKDLLTGTNGGGRKGCFFCSFINVFVTIVVAVAVIAVAAVAIVYGVGALLDVAITTATAIAAAAYGASVGAIIGATYTITDNCLDIVDYGQDQHGKQLGIQYAQC